MAFTCEQTKVLIEEILKTHPRRVRRALRNILIEMKSREPEFYERVIKHGPSMTFSSEEWFDFLSKIPTRVFREERQLMNKLSESQREKLPPATIG